MPYKFKSSRRSKGQAMVEFAIVMPVFMTFLLLFIQLVIVMHTKYVLDYSAYSASRAGIVNAGCRICMGEAVGLSFGKIYSALTGEGDYMSAEGESSLGMMGWFVQHRIGNTPSSLNKLDMVLENDDKISAASDISDLSQNERMLKVKLYFDCPLKVPLAGKILSEMSPDGLTEAETGDYPAIRLMSLSEMRITSLTNKH